MMMGKMKKITGVLLALAMVIGLLPGTGMTGQADGVTWSSDCEITSDLTIDGGVTVTTDKITVTIAKGVKVTVNGGIDAGSKTKTMTFAGEGELAVTGAPNFQGIVGSIIIDGPDVTVTGGRNTTGVNGNIRVNKGKITVTSGAGADSHSAAVFGRVTVNGGSAVISGRGSGNLDGGAGVFGAVIVNGGSAVVTGAAGGPKGGNGGPGILGDDSMNSASILTVNGGSATVTGGTGGGTGGDGGPGIKGNGRLITVTGGSAVVTGGKGGSTRGTGGPGATGWNSGEITVTGGSAAVSGGDGGTSNAASGIATGKNTTITGTMCEESDDGSAWTVFTGTSSEKKYVRITTPVLYPLWVGGRQVTSGNAANITGGGTVTASYDADSNTLTLDNADVATAAEGKGAVHYAGDNALTIEAAGSNTIGSGTVSSGIHAEKASLIIRGSGTVTVSGENNGIRALGDITVSSGTVDASGATGICADSGAVKIKGGTVIAAGKQRAISKTVINEIAGTGWTNTEGTEGKTAIAASADPGQELDFKKVQFPAVAAAAITIKPKAGDLTYTGSAQELVSAGTADGGTLLYALGNASGPAGEYTASVPAKTDAGTYSVWYYAKGDEQHNDSKASCVNVTVKPKALSSAMTRVEPMAFLYDGKSHAPAVSVMDGRTTLEADRDYTVSGTTEASNVSGENGYQITFTGKGNYSGSVTETWAISEHIAVIKAVPAASAITFGQSLADSELTGGSVVDQNGKALDGTFVWSDETIKPDVSDSNRTEYEVIFCPDNDIYPIAACVVKLAVNSAEPKVTAPAAKDLTYNGRAQELVSAGAADGGTLLYAPGNESGPSGEYTASVPAATDAGTYSVWYYAKGDGKHSDSKPARVDVTIKPKALTGAMTRVEPLAFLYDGNSHAPALSVLDGRTLLEAGKDYTVSGTTEASNVSQGNGYEITFTGKGNYGGSVTETWVIGEHIAVIKEAPAASAITCGQMLADSELTGGRAADQNGIALSGTFVWSDETIKPDVSDSNRTEYEVIFCPDNDIYPIAVCMVKLAVKEEDKKPEKNAVSFMQRLYRLILGREPEDAGNDNWTKQLASGKMGAAQVIAAFVGSPEYKAQKHSKEDTVRCLYRVMLGREADEQGLDTWAAALYGGKPVMKVIEGLGLTDKFFALCEEYGVDPGLIRGESPMPGTNALKTKALVSGIYKGLLGRNADKAGLENWAGKLLTGKASALQVVAGIMGSQEFKNRKLTNSQTVEDLYEAMLGRKPDAAGLKTWKAKLDAGYSVNTVINGIAGSKEFIGICKECGITVGKLPEGEKPVGPVSEYTNEEKVKAFVEHTYQAVFGRKGDEKGIADHTQMILKGRLTPDKLIRSFINSSEFKGKNLSSEETVKALYRAYLYREADGDGLKQWVNKLEGGTTLDEVMKGFAGSNEFKAILKGMK